MPETGARPKDVVINGRFLAQRLSGVQRYAREITTALDRLIVAEPQSLGRRRWTLAVPRDAADDLPLSAIARDVVGTAGGHRWEQVDLARAARGARLVNLGNSGPLLHRDALVVIHDAAPYRTPANFDWRYALFHRALGRLLARTATLGTVSEFSRGELSAVLGVPAARIFVANNGCDHLIGRPRSPDVTARLGVTPGRYLLFVGNPTPNKNLVTALAAFRRLARDDVKFVLVGSLDTSVFGGEAPGATPGLVLAKGLPDADIAGLYAGAAALVFPSVYEGFGIPPLEAMACGCPVIAADIPVTREVCADAATYFPPLDAAALAARMAEALDERVRPEAAGERIARYTWHRAAASLATAIGA